MSTTPEHWEAADIGDLLDGIKAGKNLKCEERPPEAHERGVIKVSAVTWGTFDAQQSKTLPYDFRPDADTAIKAGDFLFSRANTLELVGAVVMAETSHPNLFLSDKVLRLDMEATIKPWLLKFLRSPEGRRRLSEISSGNQLSMRNIGQAALKTVSVPIPPLPEQRRIVAKLDRLSARSAAARDHLARTTKLATRAKQAILARAFTGSLTAGWRETHPSQERVVAGTLTTRQAKKVSHRPFVAPFEIPNTWQWLRLPELGELDRGKSKHRPRNDKALFGGGYPFVQTGDVRAAPQYLTEYSKAYSEFGLSQSRLWPVGTVCITIAANIAETAILGIDACFPDSVVGFTAGNDRAVPEYVEYFIRTVRGDLESFAPATAQKNINLETLYDVRVPTPPVSEQAEIVRRIEAAFSRIDRMTEEASRAAHLLDRLDERLLAKAFRGELVPQDPEDEPAEALLTRIREARAAAPKAKRGRRKAS